jgi:hypothetical protein
MTPIELSPIDCSKLDQAMAYFEETPRHTRRILDAPASGEISLGPARTAENDGSCRSKRFYPR